MKGIHNNPDFILDKAIAAVRNDQADPLAEQAATANAWQRISQAVGVEATLAPLNRIEGCADVLRLLSDFEAHKLSPARAMLVADHLRECATCRVQANSQKHVGSILPWRADSVVRPRRWSFGQYALAASLVIAAVLGVAIGRSGLLAPAGYRAALESVQGTLYRVDANGEHRAKPGDQFAEGETLRTASGSRAMLRLRDGSLVEMNGRSELYVSVGWRNTSLNLARGIVIVQAAKRHRGHLYVDTPDARVAVTGTIFSVNSGIKGSRVSVIEGTVHVAQAAGDAVLRAG
ncbi:MAG TPA: FecR domain-containing protein, partial [Terriglobales bacterium]|nr:FecR domain-containing protein [Terriglobales bacterium]